MNYAIFTLIQDAMLTSLFRGEDYQVVLDQGKRGWISIHFGKEMVYISARNRLGDMYYDYFIEAVGLSSLSLVYQAVMKEIIRM